MIGATMGMVLVACWAARTDERPTDRHEDIQREPDQLGRQGREAVEAPFGPPIFDDNSLADHIAESA